MAALQELPKPLAYLNQLFAEASRSFQSPGERWMSRKSAKSVVAEDQLRLSNQGLLPILIGL